MGPEGDVRVGRSEVDEERNRVFGAGLVQDPYPEFHRRREIGGLQAGSISEHFGIPPTSDAGSWTGLDPLTAYSYLACTDVLRDAGSFSSTWYDHSLSAFIGPTMIGMDDPGHRRMRLLLQPAFSRRQMEWWIPEYVLPVVDEHLGRIAPLGACDIYREVGSAVPIHTMAAALGLPVADREQFFDWAVRMTSSTLEPAERLRAARDVGEYALPLVARRRADGAAGRDLLSLLVRAPVDAEDAGDEAVDDRPLSDDEIAGFVRLLVIAGAGTTYRAYGNLMHALLTHPDQLAQVRADRSLVRGAIEESLRLEQPIAHWGRTALREREVQGVPVPAGAPVNVHVGAANHDPARFPDPERYDIHRANAERHLTFGFGIHRCLGIHLAQAELVTLLNRTLDVLPDLHLDPDAEGVEMTGLGFRMPTRLPVRYTPTTVRGALHVRTGR